MCKEVIIIIYLGHEGRVGRMIDGRSVEDYRSRIGLLK